jgi:SAM-dependent methyltransferase
MVLTPHREYVMPEHLVVLTGVGTDSLDWIGEMHVRNYKKYMGLWSEMTFLEIGSGIGRDAFQLLNVIGLNGRYIGVDVTRDSIAWCQKNISRSHPNFEFYHFDARHELYNPLGANTTLDFRLPAADGSVDRIAAGSVFTHLFEDEIVHYMREIARVLKPDGRAYATFFLYSESNIVASRAKSVTPFNLRFEHAFAPGCFINDAAYPTGAVAYTDEAMQHMINRAGARLVCPYVEGYWSGVNPDADDSQEVLILSTRKM